MVELEGVLELEEVAESEELVESEAQGHIGLSGWEAGG